MDSYTIRPYKLGDETSINRSFNEVFGVNRSVDEWYWKFRPENDGSRIMIAIDGEKNVLAHFAATLTDVQIDGRIFRCGQSLDIFGLKRPVSLQHRLYAKTGNKFFDTFGAPDGVPIFYGFPGKRAHRHGRMQIGFGNSVPVWVGTRHVKNRRLIFWKVPERSTCDLESVARLWERVSNRYPVSTIRNTTYLQHRYLDRPDNKYTYLQMGAGSVTKAWSVVKIEKNMANWVDLIWDGESKDAIVALDGEVSGLARRAGAKLISMWISGDDRAKEVLESIGWEFSEHPRQVLASRSFHPEINSGDFIRRFYYTMGDSDMV
jgi:hypothetical protein